MIIYFSATGNSKYVAERIAKTLKDTAISIVDCIEKETYDFTISDGEKIGIVSPTYAWKLPLIVEEFLSRFHVSIQVTTYVFFVATYGTTPGQTGYFTQKLLVDNKIALSAAYGVKMPDNWTPTFDLSNSEKVKKINISAEKYINKILKQIEAEKEGNFQFPRTPHFTDEIAAKQYEKMRETKHFNVEDTCIGCGLCQRKCPAHVIRLEDGKPVWKADKCYMCLGCLHRCPAFSIQYEERTKSHGQYLNPYVKI